MLRRSGLGDLTIAILIAGALLSGCSSNEMVAEAPIAVEPASGSSPSASPSVSPIARDEPRPDPEPVMEGPSSENAMAEVPVDELPQPARDAPAPRPPAMAAPSRPDMAAPPPPPPPPPPPSANGGDHAATRCEGIKPLTLSPPKPSAAPVTLNNARFLRQGATLERVANQLLAALSNAGYVERGFFCVKNGFALATRLERIRTDKTPFPGDARWNTGRAPLLDLDQGFSLSAMLKALFRADPGRYRMIVFYVTDQAVTPGDAAPPASFASLPSSGASELPAPLGAQSYTNGHRVRALVYEFARPSVSAAPGFVDLTLPTETHLRRAGLMQRLVP